MGKSRILTLAASLLIAGSSSLRLRASARDDSDSRAEANQLRSSWAFAFFRSDVQKGGTGADRRRHHVYRELMLARNWELLGVLPSLSMSNSIASTGDSGFRTLRSTQMRAKSSLGISSSSFLVPER